MKKIPLKHTNRFTLVDDEDYKQLVSLPYKSWLYYRNKAGNEYARARIKLSDMSWSLVLMHRVIMGAEPGEEVDHVDRDGLDNRRQNLRLSTRSQNNGNQAKTRGTSRFKGVYWDKGRQKWHAQICLGSNRRAIGRFDSEEEAARAYDAAAVEQWGEFARVNFPAMILYKPAD